jgi:diacylglycerol kinase
MVCCTFIAGLLALLLRPLISLRGNPLAWRPSANARRTMLLPLLLTTRIQSFAYALAGIRFTLRNEPNMRIHLAIAAMAVVAGVWLRIDAADWRWLILAIALVLATETLNTAVEQCCNAISREFNPEIKAAKDVAAGAVLISAVCAALIGLSVFAPYFLAVDGPTPPNLHFLICGWRP